MFTWRYFIPYRGRYFVGGLVYKFIVYKFNMIGRINEVAIHWASLVLRWATVRIVLICTCNQATQVIHPWEGAMSISGMWAA